MKNPTAVQATISVFSFFVLYFRITVEIKSMSNNQLEPSKEILTGNN